MGQAKNRGSFEERKAEAVVANEKRLVAIEQRKAEREARMTPEERSARRKAQMFMAMGMGLSAGVLGGIR